MSNLEILTLADAEETHTHDHHQLVMPVAGLAEFNIAGRVGRIAPGIGCVIPGQSLHAFAGRKGNRLLILNIEHDLIPADAQSMFKSPSWFRVDQPLMSLLGSASDELLQFPDDKVLAELLCGSVVRSLQLRFAKNWQPLANTSLAMDQICEYIDLNLENPLPVSELSSLAGMSDSRFYDSFKMHSNQTPHQYILARKLDMACRLLLTTTDSLSDIAQRTGFGSQSSLSRVMREKNGNNPDELS